MKLSLSALVIVAAIVVLPGCATEGSVDPAMHTFNSGRLPPADIVLNIPGLGPCTDNPDRSLHLNSQQPVTVLVHGCFGSAGLFRGLAQVLVFHGQQTVCFTYNDRDSMMVSSAEMISALEQLANRMTNKYVTVIGYSQGALIARKALVTSPYHARHAATAGHHIWPLRRYRRCRTVWQLTCPSTHPRTHRAGV